MHPKQFLSMLIVISTPRRSFWYVNHGVFRKFIFRAFLVLKPLFSNLVRKHVGKIEKKFPFFLPLDFYVFVNSIRVIWWLAIFWAHQNMRSLPRLPVYSAFPVFSFFGFPVSVFLEFPTFFSGKCFLTCSECCVKILGISKK